MIRSMTGYGKASGEFSARKISAEIRSLNSKQLDLNIRVPQIYKDKEIDLRNWASKNLERGRVDLSLSVDEGGEEVLYTIVQSQVERYYNELEQIRAKLKSDSDILAIAMRLPDVLRSKKDEATEEEWKAVIGILTAAGEKFNEFRKSEGASLAKDLSLRINNIKSLTEQVEALEPARTAQVKKRLRSALEESNLQADNDRFEQEIIFYLEKLDITEEKVRLLTHCDYFIETMNSNESEGRKLNFISQEIGREINTMGSKANDATIQKLVVQMKDELEKIREQVNNVL